MPKRAFLAALFAFFLRGVACAQFEEPPVQCAAGTCDGVFSVGPHKMRFFATQTVEGEEVRYFREIQYFGLTQLNIEFLGEDGASAASDDSLKNLDVGAQLFWGKNELIPPELMEAHQSKGAAPIRFEHLFTHDGKYILSVKARAPDGAAYEGQYVFFVVATAESGLPIAALAALATAGFIYFIWKTRRPVTRPVRRR
ncbi:MAG: hypothetical protein N2444_05210 [Methylocystis sp.]|nr:hypothetical protein [Methylocystis sp.]